jgi:signal transduction histidine kinase
MKNLLPDTMAVRAMVLLVVGLAVSHLLSNVFYALDREQTLLNAGGEHAVQWAAMVGNFAETIPPDQLAEAARNASPDHRFLTVTDFPVVAEDAVDDWREMSLHRELAKHLTSDRLKDFRISYNTASDDSPAMRYWRSVLGGAGQEMPEELIVISMRLADWGWLNMATRLEPPAMFFSARLGWSMAVMLIAVVLISALIVGKMTEPLTRLSRAAEKLGTDVQAPAIPETGPEEVRRTAHAFNEMQKRIRRFVDDRTQMLGAIAHDLGTPITRLRLRAEFVEEDELREKMLRDLDDMEQMVASTLSFIREDAASEPKETVDLGSLLARVCDDIKDTGASVELAEIPRWVLLECRPIALRRALGNLIENAVKYGTAARVSLELEPERVVIFIDDEGPGIPEERQEDVFQPFHRLEDSRNRETGGTGLGLAVARTIVRAHGGDIRLRNRPGGGLRVELALPRPPEPDLKGHAPGPARAPDTSGPAPPGPNARHAPNAGDDFFGADRNSPIHGGKEPRLTSGRITEWKTL